MKDRFSIVIESRHLPGPGDTENAFNLNQDELEKRRVMWLDIANDKVVDNPPEREPSEYFSEKTGRGRLQGKWWENCDPVMCCYKLVTIKFQVFGLQTRAEDIIMRVLFVLLVVMTVFFRIKKRC